MSAAAIALEPTPKLLSISLCEAAFKTEHQQWRERLEKLAVDEANLQHITALHRFAIGDLLIDGERRYAHVYEDAAKLLKSYSVKQLYSFAWVARKIKSSLRRELLSWSHYVLLASLDPALQELLVATAGERMTVSSLRRQIAEIRQPVKNDLLPFPGNWQAEAAEESSLESVEEEDTRLESLTIYFESHQRVELAELLRQKITAKTKSIRLLAKGGVR